MGKYDFLIIESAAGTVIHPIFYKPAVLNVEVGKISHLIIALKGA